MSIKQGYVEIDADVATMTEEQLTAQLKTFFRKREKLFPNIKKNKN